MRNRNRAVNWIHHYGIWQFAAAGILLYFFEPYLFNLILPLEQYSLLSNLPENELETGFRIFLAGIIIVSFALNLRDTIYEDKTGGRNYGSDHGRYKRGFFELSSYFFSSDPHSLDISKFPMTDWQNGTGIILGKKQGHLINLDTDCEANIYVNGPPGSGKTTGIACCSAARWGMDDRQNSPSASVFGIDIKGDITSYLSQHTSRKLLVFCPDSESALQKSAHFNIFDGFDRFTQTEKKLFISNIAFSLIPDEGGSDGNFFTSRARKLFIGIIWYIYHLHSLDPENPFDFPHILDVILHPNKNPNFPKTVFEWVTTITHGDCDEAVEQVASLIGNSEKNISGAWDALCTALIPFSNHVLDTLLDGKGSCISLESLDSGNDCYLQIKQENLTTYAPLFTVMISSITTQLMKRPDASSGIKNRPILLLLDEMPQLTFTFDQINTILSTLRSKSCVTMIICQDRSQLERKFKPEGARAVLANCRYQAILGCNDPQSQKIFSDLIGSKKTFRVSNSENTSTVKSGGRNVQETYEPVIRPEDFGEMKFNGRKNQIVIYYAGKYVIADKINCYLDDIKYEK